MDFTYHANIDHKCKKDVLIGRIKNVEDKSWKKIRPRPTKTNYEGPYYICKGTCHDCLCWCTLPNDEAAAAVLLLDMFTQSHSRPFCLTPQSF